MHVLVGYFLLFSMTVIRQLTYVNGFSLFLSSTHITHFDSQHEEAEVNDEAIDGLSRKVEALHA